MSSQLDGAGMRMTVAGLAALQAGDVGSPAVLLVPGYTGSKEDFAPILEPLASAGFFVTSIDLPGQYESPGPSSTDGYTTAALAEAVCAVARSLRAPVHVLGHSFGGLVTRAAVIAEPALFASLVLLSSGPAGLGGARRAQIERLEPVLASAGLAAVYAGAQAANRADPSYAEPPPELADFFERRFLASSAVGLQGMGTAVRDEPDRVAELAATGLRSLVICGEDDDAWLPDTQREMAVRLGAPFVLLPDAAHSAATENPSALTAELLSFLR